MSISATADLDRVPTRAMPIDPGRKRRAELVIAALFLVTAATSIAGVVVLDPILKAPDALAQVAPQRMMVVLGALLWAINNIGLVFIAVFAYPILRPFSEATAVGYLAARIIEGAVMMVGIMATLALIPVSSGFIAAGAPADGWQTGLAALLLEFKLLGLTDLSLPLLGLGGLFFTVQLFRFRMVPRPMALLGIAGYAMALVFGILAWFDIVDASPGGPVTLMAVPVASFEIIFLPAWLFLRGFRMERA